MDESIKVIHVISLPPGGANGGSGSSSSTGYPTSSKSGGGGGGGIHHQHVPSPPYIFSAYTQTKLHLYLCAENNGGIWRVSKKDLCAKYPTPSLSYLGKRMSGGGGSGGGNVAHMVPIHHSRGSGTGSSSSSGSGFLMDTLALFGDFCDGEVLNVKKKEREIEGERVAMSVFGMVKLV